MKSPQPLWQLNDLATLFDLEPLQHDVPIHHITTDTRRVQKGSLFVARSGEQLDGHAFLVQAQAEGAVAALVTRHQPDCGLPQLVVHDADTALETIARAARGRFQGAVIGVTGSCGKTTVKDFLKGALPAHAPISSYNNHIGLCETLANLPENEAFCVLEIGTNATGEIAQLGDISQPDIAIVTIVQPVHGAGIGSVDDICTEKLSVFNTLANDAPVLVPRSLLDALHKQHHGRFSNVHVFDEHLETPQIQFPTPARLYNAKVALAVRDILEVDQEIFNNRLAHVPVGAGRGEVHTMNGITVIDDSYNANPASTKHALEVLKTFEVPKNSRRIALLGQMNELGEDEAQYHADLSKDCEGIDLVYGVGSLMQHLQQALPEAQQGTFVEKPLAFPPEAFAETLKEGDVVLVKGSKTIFWVHDYVITLISALSALDTSAKNR